MNGSDAANLRERQRLRDNLDFTLGRVENATEIVGKEIPGWVEDWAERNGLDVRRSSFAPPGKLYIVGAVPVERRPWDVP